eukprot:g3699.t1
MMGRLKCRQLNIASYADTYTRQCLDRTRQSTMAILADPTCLGAALEEAHKAGLVVARLRMCRCRPGFDLASQLPDLAESKTGFGEVVVALEIVGEGAVRRWQDAVAGVPWGGAAYSSSTAEGAGRGLDLFFGAGQRQTLPTSADTQGALPGTLCLVKPSAVKSGIAGPVIQAIQAAGFAVTAADMFTLDRESADEFFDIYRGVLNATEHCGALNELTSGRVIALEVTSSATGGSGGGETQAEIVTRFRELCGPYVVEVAREVAPHSLRARFGTSTDTNAVHCTDVPEDGSLEREYFFKVLQDA